MSEQEIEQRLRSWVHSPSAGEAPSELRRSVLDIPATDRPADRRHQLRLLPDPTPTAGADESGGQTQPIPTNPRNGGTRSMFSATKLFGIAASIALISVMALAVPFSQQQQDTQVPGAQLPVMGEVTPFTGEMRVLGQDRVATAERFDWGTSVSGEQWTARLTTTDPRYSGITTGFHNIYSVGPEDISLRVHKSRLFTKDEDGTWVSTGHGYMDPETRVTTWVTRSTGEGDYAGLSAYSTCEQASGSTDMACQGIVFEGDWPEIPEAAPEEVPPIHLNP